MEYVCRGKVSEDEERQLVLLARTGDNEARNRLIMYHLPLVKIFAQRVRRPYYFALDDAINTAVLGMIIAIAKYEPDRGVKLMSYARHWIRHVLKTAIHYSSMYRIPSSTQEKIKRGESVTKKSWVAVQNFGELRSLTFDDQFTQPCRYAEKMFELVDAKLDATKALQPLSSRDSSILAAHSEGRTFREIARMFGLGSRQNAANAVARIVKLCRNTLQIEG